MWTASERRVISALIAFAEQVRADRQGLPAPEMTLLDDDQIAQWLSRRTFQ